MRRVEMGSSGNSVYMTLAFAGVALMAAAVVGIAVLRKRSGRQPHHQVWFKDLHNTSRIPHQTRLTPLEN